MGAAVRKSLWRDRSGRLMPAVFHACGSASPLSACYYCSSQTLDCFCTPITIITKTLVENAVYIPLPRQAQGSVVTTNARALLVRQRFQQHAVEKRLRSMIQQSVEPKHMIQYWDNAQYKHTTITTVKDCHTPCFTCP